MAALRALRLRLPGCTCSWPSRLRHGARLGYSSFVDMPPVALADPAVMNVRSLIHHMREGAVVWRIEHRPFWEAALGRLRELAEDVELHEAASLLATFQHLRLVDMALVEHCERLITQASDEQLLGIRQAELFSLIEALGNMRRPAAMAPALRLLVGRAHRMDAGRLTQVLRAACQAGCDGVADLTDDAARSTFKRGGVPCRWVPRRAGRRPRARDRGLPGGGRGPGGGRALPGGPEIRAGAARPAHQQAHEGAARGVQTTAREPHAQREGHGPRGSRSGALAA
mmetsp:Transcript_106210/g.333049  ORF Transcript_106210/g.333049 Transcript_106210/m.333049 type:complete len:284 (-) Transcript_106210:78-929(-)